MFIMRERISCGPRVRIALSFTSSSSIESLSCTFSSFIWVDCCSPSWFSCSPKTYKFPYICSIQYRIFANSYFFNVCCYLHRMVVYILLFVNEVDNFPGHHSFWKKCAGNSWFLFPWSHPQSFRLVPANSNVGINYMFHPHGLNIVPCLEAIVPHFYVYREPFYCIMSQRNESRFFYLLNKFITFIYFILLH